jgi:hypothetical protein
LGLSPATVGKLHHPPGEIFCKFSALVYVLYKVTIS